MQKWGRRFLWGYLALTLGFVLALGIVLCCYGAADFEAIQARPYGSSRPINWAAFGISWLLIGVPLWLSQAPRFARRHAAFHVVFILIGFAYLNLVREPHKVGDDPTTYGDFGAYFLAAVDMSQGQPIAQDRWRQYLYPPLLATLLAPMVPLGMDRAAQLFHLLNYGALLLLLILLYLTLQRFRFSTELAAIALLGMLVANVPLSQTLYYRQINLHVANLVLLSILLFGTHNFGSAFALSLAIHLKVYPLVLVLPFLYGKEWRWCLWFVTAHLLIVGATSALNSPRYYVECFRQLSRLSETSLQNASVDSLLYHTLRLLQLPPRPWGSIIAHGVRLVWAVGILTVWGQLLHRDLFEETGSWGVVLNSYVILPVMMLAVSPSIWSHHFVFLMLPMLVWISVLREAWEFWLYGFAYAFMFLFPTYAIYPVSYVRLLALLLFSFLFYAAARRPADAKPEWFGRLNGRLARTIG